MGQIRSLSLEQDHIPVIQLQPLELMESCTQQKVKTDGIGLSTGFKEIHGNNGSSGRRMQTFMFAGCLLEKSIDRNMTRRKLMNSSKQQKDCHMDITTSYSPGLTPPKRTILMSYQQNLFQSHFRYSIAYFQALDISFSIKL